MEFCFGVFVSCSWDLLMDVALAMVLCPAFPLRPSLLPLIKPLWDTCSGSFMIFQGFHQFSLLKEPPGGPRADAPGRHACPGQSLFFFWVATAACQAPSSIVPVRLALLRPFWSILAQAKFAQKTELANSCWQWQLLHPLPTMAVGAQAALGRWFLNEPH